MSETSGENSKPTSAEPATSSPAQLARAEKKAARRVNLEGYSGLLIGALLLYAVALFLPVTPQARGYEVLLFTLSTDQETAATLAEFVHAVLLFLGVGLFNLLVLLTRRTVFSWLAWMFTTVGLVYSVFALWMRQTQNTENTSGIGMYLSILAVALACYAFCCVSLRRDPEQAALAEARANSDNLDEVGHAQRAAMVHQQNTSYENNPLFDDDRRARAAERHRRHRRDGNNDAGPSTPGEAAQDETAEGEQPSR